MVLEISQNSQENTCATVWTFIKKETLAQVSSCEFCEISKSTYFHRTLLVAASDFNYAPLTWMFAKKSLIDNILKIHYRTLQVVYDVCNESYKR